MWEVWQSSSECTCFGVLGSAFLTCTPHCAQHTCILQSICDIAAALAPQHVQGVLTSVQAFLLNDPKLMIWL